jgi:alpha-beta hydrolase superfamily lysophospholipase
MRTHLHGQIQDVVIDGAVHDLCLSAPAPRQRYFDAVTAWLDEVLA